MMSLSGTYIIAGGADDDQAATFRSLPSVLEKGMLTAFLDGGSLQYYKCDELTKCLNPTLTNSELLTASQGFKQHILDKLTSMYSRIKNNTALDASEKDLLNLTSIPILKILNIYAAYEESLAILDMHQYADVIAIEIMTVWLVEIYTEINKLGIQSSLTESKAFKNWQVDFKLTRKEVERVQDTTLKKFKSILDILDRAQKLERHLAMSLTDDIAGNFAFSKKLSSGGF
jgi:conjugative transfer pilus assembly protein TraH